MITTSIKLLLTTFHRHVQEICILLEWYQVQHYSWEECDQYRKDFALSCLDIHCSSGFACKSAKRRFYLPRNLTVNHIPQNLDISYRSSLWLQVNPKFLGCQSQFKFSWSFPSSCYWFDSSCLQTKNKGQGICLGQCFSTVVADFAISSESLYYQRHTLIISFLFSTWF